MIILPILKSRTSLNKKDTKKRIKRQATEWEKIFLIHITNKGLIVKVYKESQQIIKGKITKRKLAKRLNTHDSADMHDELCLSHGYSPAVEGASRECQGS